MNISPNKVIDWLSMPEVPIKLFFSYSHRDEALRDELANHLSILRRQGVISTWHDRKITAGTEWAQVIDEEIRAADIINLDTYKQLLTKLASQDGYPLSDRSRTDLKLLQSHLNLADEDVRRIEDEIVQPLPPDPSEDDPPYAQLEAFLQAGQWDAADWETCRVMHVVLGKEYIKVKDLRTFPCEAIAEIDKLWRKYSNNKFGFGVQADLWKELERNDEAFNVRVGWQKDSAKRQRRRKDLNFSLDASIGHLPAFYKSWGGGGWSWKDYILTRTAECLCAIDESDTWNAQ